MRRLRILTWHVHGNYLWYLSQARHEFILPVDASGRPGFGGRGKTFPFGPNVREVPTAALKSEPFDLILFQTRSNFDRDQHELFTAGQRRLPKIYLEHDPPQEHPTDQPHWAAGPDVMLVHVTPFNALMWNSGRSPVRVIEHGVIAPGSRYRGNLARGLVVINHLKQRGRRLGVDVFLEARRRVELDLVGMAAEDLGGIGEIQPTVLPQFMAAYRFFFNPIRYTSLGLAVIEAMTLGMPIVGLATTEMATAIQNGVTGYVDTSLDKLVPRMRDLIAGQALARELGENARRYALERFGLDRFVADWEQVLAEVTLARSAEIDAAREEGVLA